jgi:hypothetical protein
MVHHGLKKTALWGNFTKPKPIYNNWENVPKNNHLYIRPGRKKPGLAFLHKSAIEHIKEFEPFKPYIKNDSDFRSLCSQGFAKEFYKVNKMNKIKKILLGSAFLVAIFIDLGLNIVSMATIAPAGLYVVAFIGIAFLTVLFAVQAWIKRNYILWLVLAFITLFFDVSFILASTELKSESITIIVTASSDPELKRIETAINEATDDKNPIR